MTKLLTIILLFTANTALAHNYKKPEEAVQAYIIAVSTGSGEHIEMAYLEDATIKFYNQDNVLREYTRQSFAEAVNTGSTWDASIKITNLLVTGKVANATVEFTWGEKGEHGYVDYLNLIHDGNSWHISNKVAQYIPR